MNKVLFIATHGVEFDEIKSDFANKLFNGIRDNLTETETEHLRTLAYNWTSYTHDRQMTAYTSFEKGLHRQKLRKLKHTIGSDVAWSQRLQTRECFYGRFLDDMKALIQEQISGPEDKVIVFGHSQGSQNALNFVYDCGRTIDCFISAGSPVSMYSGMFNDWGKLPPNLKKWVNMYNAWDFVSSRIQAVHPSEAIRNFVQDKEIGSGFNPLHYTLIGAHTLYWRSDQVHKIIAKIIKDLMK